MSFGIYNNRQIRISNYINDKNLIFFPTKKEAEINATQQRFQLLLLYLIIWLEHNTHLIPLSTAMIR